LKTMHIFDDAQDCGNITKSNCSQGTNCSLATPILQARGIHIALGRYIKVFPDHTQVFS
jgi:hypothetical protein